MMVRGLMVDISNNFVIPSEARNLSAGLIRAQKQRRDSSLRSE
jgi:hypothetical protein